MSGSSAAGPVVGNNISGNSENDADVVTPEEDCAILAGVESNRGESSSAAAAATAAADDASPYWSSTPNRSAAAAIGGEDGPTNDGNKEPTEGADCAVKRDENENETTAAVAGGKRKKDGSGEGTKKRAKKPSSSSRSPARAKAKAIAEMNKAKEKANAESNKANPNAKDDGDGEAKGVDVDERNHRDFRGGSERWNAMLFQLLLYKAEFGDVHVRYDYDRNRPLVNWVHQQRIHYKRYQQGKKSHMTEERISVLSATGFLFKQRGEAFWQKNYAKLLQYRQEKGDCLVPRDSGQLGEWVTDQRRQRKYLEKGKPSPLTPERVRKLDEIGFTWAIRPRTSWDTRYEELLQFKNLHGHVVVPQHYSENKQLGKWVAKQREQFRAFRAGKKEAYIKQEQIEKLQELGFIWNAKGRSNIHSGDIAL